MSSIFPAVKNEIFSEILFLWGLDVISVIIHLHLVAGELRLPVRTNAGVSGSLPLCHHIIPYPYMQAPCRRYYCHISPPARPDGCVAFRLHLHNIPLPYSIFLSHLTRLHSHLDRGIAPHRTGRWKCLGNSRLPLFFHCSFFSFPLAFLPFIR